MYAARVEKKKRLRDMLNPRFVNNEQIQNAILAHARIVAKQFQNSFSTFYFEDELKEPNLVKQFPNIIINPSIYIMGPRHSATNRKRVHK